MPLAEIPLSVWRKRSQTFEFHGRTIRYWVAGQGEPLLLIHGFPTASWDWHYLWQPLAQRNLVIACDMLGFGDSAKPLDHGYCLLEQADLQQALLEHLRVEQPVHVLAHDYGDSVAQELLARHYEGRFQMASCVFLNGGCFLKPIARRWYKSSCSAPGLDDRPCVWAQCHGEQLQPDIRPQYPPQRKRPG